MSELSKRGSQGGKARKEKLSPERRSEIAKVAASKRWSKKDIPPDKDKEIPDPKIITGITILNGGPGTEPRVTVDVAPAPPEPIPAAPQALQASRKPRSRSMPKAFKGASAYAEKRLQEAMRERAEAMNIVAARNAEIPSLVSVIKALGTSTIPPEALQSYPLQMPNYAFQETHYRSAADPMQNLPNPIDPALYATNSNPVPGLSPAVANAPLVLDKPMGGAIDLGYTPVDEEGPPLPKMGTGWV